ncbi:MAG: ATP-binding domain-containing protein, partial [Lentisphaeria bacterium]|nr:ATP-binding domain-containing protein [Lentisphaeria bacterium]
TQHYVMLQRNLIYTGMTRAKKLLIMIGTRKALEIAVSNNTPLKRLSLLARRLSTQSRI